MNANMEKYGVLCEKMKEIEKEIKDKNKELEDVKKEIKKLFPSGYWWAYEIDDNWRRPKKYRITEVGDGYVVVKEVYKKAPWKGFTGESCLSLKEFLNLQTFKTEEDAKKAVYNRPCPKCGGIMKYTTEPWCNSCMEKRIEDAQIFNKNNRYYDAKKKVVYQVRYTDEITAECAKGYYGKHFTIRRLDDGTIIKTDNLHYCGEQEENKENLPLIEFIEE